MGEELVGERECGLRSLREKCLVEASLRGLFYLLIGERVLVIRV